MFSDLLRTLFGPGTWGAGGNLASDLMTLVPGLLIQGWRHRRHLRAELAAMERRLTGGSHAAAPSSSTAAAALQLDPAPPPTSGDENGPSRPSEPLSGGSGS